MTLLLIPLSILAAVIPMATLLVVVWLMDRYQREPIWLFALTFLWGGVGGVLLALLFNPLVELGLTPVAMFLDRTVSPEGWEFQSAMGATIVAPLVEEPSKALFLLFVLASRKFDTLTDGFVYGAAAGLGFGMTENALYFVNNSADLGSWMHVVLIRTCFSAIMHATATGCVGACLALARLRPWPWAIPAAALGLGVGMSMHALWNGLLSIEQINATYQAGGHEILPVGVLYLADLAFLPLEVIVTVIIFQLSLWDESRTIRRELAEEAANGLIPKDHPARLASFFARHRLFWHPPGLDHRRYVAAATTLALRKRQMRAATGRWQVFFSDDIKRLRRQVQLLLAAASGAAPGSAVTPTE